MKIKWYGHSCFLMTNGEGIRVLTDPCDPSTGYKLADIETDIVTLSHNHHDHNYTAAAKGSYTLINKPGSYTVKGVRITGIKSYHDDALGKKRGENICFKFETEGLSVVHAGDIGAFDAKLVTEIGKTDVLLVPIGGVYTIDAEGARALANSLSAKVVIPMHYKTPALTFELGDINSFIRNAADCSIHDLKQSEASISADCLGTDRILILEYEKPKSL